MAIAVAELVEKETTAIHPPLRYNGPTRHWADSADGLTQNARDASAGRRSGEATSSSINDGSDGNSPRL